MNTWCFTGHIGNDCKVQSTQGGTAVCSFNVAVSSGFGDKEKTTWARCAIFGKRAEGKLPEHLTKGQKVAISGELTLDEWQDQQGAKQKMLTVRVNELDLIGVKAEQNTQSQAPRQQAPQQQAQQPVDDFTDDSIPF
tara:strand:+ start:4071 stop:4481 length:411 start_codon:yes stop_codon:yes gene_type:complete